MSKRTFIVLTILLVSLIIVFMNIKNRSQTEEMSYSDSSVIPLTTIKECGIESIRISNENGVFLFANQNGKWHLKQPEGVNADEGIISEIASDIEYAYAFSTADENPDNLKQFGFGEGDKPAEVKIIFKDGEVEEFYLGNDVPSKQGAYVKRKKEPSVYITFSKLVNSIRISKEDLVSKPVN